MNRFILKAILSAANALSCLFSTTAVAQDSADLAKQLANPVAALISVPFQFNYDESIGPVDDGERFTLNIQPVIPISLSTDWNLISRTILPVMDQQDIFPGSGGQSGLGDTVQSIFFSPKKPTAGGWIWGAGPVFLVPTATDDLLGSEKWGAGPTAVVLKQQGPWTYGALVNQIWSFAGDSNRNDESSMFLQPFLNHTSMSAVSVALQTEATYDWLDEQWTVPLIVNVSKVTKIGGQLVSVGGGIKYYIESLDAGPQDWGFRLVVTLLFPK